MDLPASSKTNERREGWNGWVDWFFIKIETFAYSHSLSVLIVCILLAFASVWVTSDSLKFKTSRDDLVSRDLKYNRLYEAYREEFEDFDGMLVVVEGTRPDEMAEFAKELVHELKKNEHLFSQVFFKVDIGQLKKKALYFLELSELKDLNDTVISRQEFIEEINLSPGLNQLLISMNREISAGMVDTLMSEFIGEKESSAKKEDSGDLKFLVHLFQQMMSQLNGDSRYRSPWSATFSGRGDSLKEQGYLVSEDESMLFILLNPKETKGDFKGSKASIDKIRELIRKTGTHYLGIKVGLTGGEVISSDEMAATLADVSRAAQISLIGVAFLFIIVFRGVVKPLMAVFSLLLALCWAMGFTTLTVGHLNILSVVFTTILIGLGIDFGIHILERYREERSSGKNIPAALQETIHGTGKGNFAGAVTTAMAFGAMTLTDFLGIAELGWIAGFGILFCLIAMLLLLPALIALEEKLRGNSYKRKTLVMAHSGILERFFLHYKLIIGTCVATVVVSMGGFFSLSFDYNILNLQAKGTEAVQYEMKVLDRAKRSTWYAVMVSPTLEEAQQRYKQVKTLPLVGRVESILSVLPEKQEDKLKVLKNLRPLTEDMEIESEDAIFSWKRLLKTVRRILFKLRDREEGKEFKNPAGSVGEAKIWAQRFLNSAEEMGPELGKERLEKYSERLFQDYRATMADFQGAVKADPMKIDDIPDSLRKRFVGKSGKYQISIYPNANIYERGPMKVFLEQLREVDDEVTGNAVHMFESTTRMQEGYILGGLYALVAIVIYIYSTLKTLRGTFFVLLPTIVGSIWTVGIMELTGVQFNLANLVILPLIIGIGVVNGIHITHRYREETNNEICVLSKSTGKAVVLSSLTTMIGFGSLMIADHRGVFSLGFVLTLGVGSCMIASIILLPALLQLCTVKGWKV